MSFDSVPDTELPFIEVELESLEEETDFGYHSLGKNIKVYETCAVMKYFL